MISLSYFSLTFITFASVFADVLPFLQSKSYQDGTWGLYPAQTFLSDRYVVAPVPNVLTNARSDVSPENYITWAPHGSGIPVTGPQLLDADTLSVVYQAPTFAEDNFGLSVQTCNNTDYLVWWAGTNIEGRAAGQYYIFNTDYESVWNVTSIGLKYADAHDVFITPDCHAVFTVNEPREYNLTEWGIENGWIMESYFQEIDLATNQLLFQWRASDHVDMKHSFWIPSIRGHLSRPQGTREDDSWDFFHINSVQKDSRGNYMISARHFASIYYIDGKTGSILWTLGGIGNDFTDLSDGQATNFAWQHHARWASDDLTKLSVFDDKNCRYIKSEDPVSRGIIFDLDYMTRSVKATSYRATSEIQSFRKGSMLALSNGNALLGYGNEPGFTEYDAHGTVLYDVRFGPVGLDRETADSYRTLKVNWTGNPTWSPKITAGPFLQDSYRMLGAGATEALPSLPNNTAYFSWNGGTRLAKWAILASNNDTRLDNMAHLWCELPKTGFETTLQVGDTARYIRAIAISADDDVLSASSVLDMWTGKTTEQYWSHLDLNSQWKEGQTSDGTEDDAIMVDDYEALKEDWQSMKATMQKVLVALVVGGSLGVVFVVAAMAWNYGGAWLASIKRKGRHTRDEYIDISDDEEFSIGSLEIPRLDHIGSDNESDDKKEKRRSLAPEYPLYDGEGRGLLTLGIT